MSLMQIQKSSIDTSIYLTNRTAIDSSGRVGWLYDGYQDRLLGQLNVVDQEKLYQSHKVLRCEIIHGGNDRHQNLLRLLSIDEQLRLSILLKLVPGKGIASIVDHPYPTNKYTRLLNYSYVDRIQRLPDRVEEARHYINSPMPQNNATHIVTNVEWGIDLVVVLQLPPDDETRQEIDRVLKRMYTCLYCNYNTSVLISDEEPLLEKITHTSVYSNIPDLCNVTTLLDVCRYIEQNKNSTANQPISYVLRPIQWFYPEYNGIGAIFIHSFSELNNIEQYVFQLTADIKILETFVNENVPKLLNDNLKERFSVIQNQWIEVKNKCTLQIDRISKLVIDIRSGRVQNLTIDHIFNDNEQWIMKTSIRNLIQTLKHIEEKSHLISDLSRQQIQYYDVTEFNVDRMDTIQTIERKLVKDVQHDRILCSSDFLNKTNSKQLHKLRCDLVEELETNSNLRLFYADFSYCSFELHTMMILPSGIYDIEKNKSKQKEKLAILPPTKLPIPVVPSISTDGTINVLFLGETGVGKSTFINAFVNYLTFKTFQEAQSNKSIALIPGSFLITVNNNLDKRAVKFGDVVSSNNEDSDHPGQSVTQHCKSYIFHVGHNGGKRLRIIDTPGFGDTRGADQDELNLQHILEYTHNFTHLNAVCFFHKSNALHVHKFFRSCLTQLLTLLDPNARNNIIFCFTNGRSTFYSPGDMVPLLKTMLTSIPVGDVPFNEENTFCFDNESFRYLVALQNNIPFSDHEKQEHEMSWSMSVTESNRLIDYISKNLIACQIRHDFQSIRHVQIETVRMIRPILETMRNILRNTVLWNMDSPNKSIELRPTVFTRPAMICLSCKSKPYQMGNFWIGRTAVHEFANGCRTCQCPLNQHMQTDYVLEYEYLNNPSKYNRIQMKNILNQLCHASAEFYYFLIHIARSSKEDPFLIGLTKMIAEEKYLSESQNPNYLNLQLVNDLKQLRSKYEQQKKSIGRNEENSKLQDTYTLINAIREYPMMREQMIATMEGRKMMMKQHEYEVSKDARGTVLHSSATHQNSSNT